MKPINAGSAKSASAGKAIPLTGALPNRADGRANCVFLRPCWFEVLIQDVWIDVGTVGPGDGAGSRLNLHLAKSSQIGPDRVKDRALDISPD